MRNQEILSLLKGGDRRSIGRSDRVTVIVSKNPKLFSKLIAGLWSSDPLIRMRAADAAEKITRKNPDRLTPHKKTLLGLMAESLDQELRWHLAVMIPRLRLTPKEVHAVTSYLESYLEDRSSIVRTLALQGLCDLAEGHPNLRSEVIERLRQAARAGTPAMKARSRRLLLRMERT